MKQLLYFLLGLFVFACSSNDSDTSTQLPKNQLAFNNFEAVAGWTSGVPVPSLTSEKAHSGRYAVQVTPAVEYALGFASAQGRLSVYPLTKLRVRAWVNLPNAKATAVLVTEVKDPAGKTIFWDGINLSKEVETFNRWVEVDKTLTLPPNQSETNELRVYLWRNQSTQGAFLDDLQLLSAN